MVCGFFAAGRSCYEKQAQQVGFDHSRRCANLETDGNLRRRAMAREEVLEGLEGGEGESDE